MRRTAEEWGRVAVSLPGWRGMPGMLDGRRGAGCRYSAASTLSDDWWSAWGWPDPDDPATAGCLLELLICDEFSPSIHTGVGGTDVELWDDQDGEAAVGSACNLGRACIAAAEQLGRWPGARLPIPAGLGG